MADSLEDAIVAEFAAARAAETERVAALPLPKSSDPEVVTAFGQLRWSVGNSWSARITPFGSERLLVHLHRADAALGLARFVREHADEIEAGWPEVTALVDEALGYE
jgi:hypothetical protein